MKFTLVKLSALALVAAASTVSAEDPKAKLRGSSKAPPKLDGAVQTKVYLSDESPDHESADLKDASSDSNGFFPDEMNEEDKRNRNNRNRNDDDDDDNTTQQQPIQMQPGRASLTPAPPATSASLQRMLSTSSNQTTTTGTINMITMLSDHIQSKSLVSLFCCTSTQMIATMVYTCNDDEFV
eukprot:65393_1